MKVVKLHNIFSTHKNYEIFFSIYLPHKLLNALSNKIWDEKFYILQYSTTYFFPLNIFNKNYSFSLNE